MTHVGPAEPSRAVTKRSTGQKDPQLIERRRAEVG
jgi:hypothetical protein